MQPWTSCSSFTYVCFVTKQYNLVPANELMRCGWEDNRIGLALH